MPLVASFLGRSLLLLLSFFLFNPTALAQRYDRNKSTSVASPSAEAVPDRNNSAALPPAQWIWLAGTTQGRIAEGDVYFRKTIELPKVPIARFQIAANDAYEIYLNGRRVGTGAGMTNMQSFECAPLVIGGDNVIAIRASNRSGGTAALFSRFFVQLADGQWRGMGTSETWKCSSQLQAGWQTSNFDDSKWANAINAAASDKDANGSDGRMAAGRPDTSDKTPFKTVAQSKSVEANQNSITEDSSKSKLDSFAADGMSDLGNAALMSQRFKTLPGFVVEQIVSEIDSGSIIAMAFNEFGHIIASQEGGPLLLIYETNKTKKTQRIRTYCDLVKNIQGILPLNGNVFVTGDGPEGNGLYKLIDSDRDGLLEAAEKIFAVKGITGEHGTHQIALGPDGMLYVVLGNHVSIDATISPTSPYRFTYEGDLVQPRREDPSGHAAGMKAPGGTVIRVDLRTNSIDIVAGGLRNAYDLAFHPTEGLFLQDSDMEADIGTTWHRPTNLFKIAEGGEYGWRSGWAAWPDYFADRLPATADTGRGSPTGAVFYDHYQYPSEYHEKMFVGDWSQGRIVALDVEADEKGQLKPAIEFVTGSPMNITDLEVGPDGAIYFCTGGRGTGGGIYRVRWTGEPMIAKANLGSGIARAIRQPQLGSAWGRQAIAMQKRDLNDKWDDLIAGVAFSPDNPARYRMKALDLMQLVGPVPSVDLLIDLSRTPTESLRIKVAQQLALHSDAPEAITRLTEMLRDSSPKVQASAASGLIRTDAVCDVTDLVPLLKSENRTLQFLSRRLLLRLDLQQWNTTLLESDNPQVVINAALASVIKDAGQANTARVVDRLHSLLDVYMSDETFVNLVRAYQVALHLGPVSAEQLAQVRQLADREFPAGQPIINREIIRLAAYSHADTIVPRVMTYISSDAPVSDRVHVAMYTCAFYDDWTQAQRTKLLEFFEDAQRTEGGSSYALYIMQFCQTLGEQLTTPEATAFLQKGERYPNAALSSLPKLPEQLSVDLLEDVVRLDTKIDQRGFEDDVYKRLKTGLTAILARSGDERSMRYLRQVWRRSPDRRPSVALALAQKPDGENWDYVIRSLGLIESYATAEILTQLASVQIATDDPAAIRQTILHALKFQLAGQSAKPALELLSFWVGENMAAGAKNEAESIAAWQYWFKTKHPDKPDPELPAVADSKWSVDDLDQYFDSEQGRLGNVEAGKLVYNKAQCAACHRFGDNGLRFGPDLTTLSSRFTRRETLESVLYPSHVISDQYASSKILTRAGNIETGLMIKDDRGNIKLRDATGKTIAISAADVEEVLVSKVSMMPSGLMDSLTQPEIRDLMSYLKLLPAEKENVATKSANAFRR